MNALMCAKMNLYMHLLKLYEVEGTVIMESDIRLMDALLRDKEVMAHIRMKMGV